MHAGYEKAGDREQPDGGRTDQRHIEIAGARPVRVERCAVLPAAAGDGTSPADDPGTWRDVAAQGIDELVEPLATAAERQADEVLHFFRHGQTALGIRFGHSDVCFKTRTVTTTLGL